MTTELLKWATGDPTEEGEYLCWGYRNTPDGEVDPVAKLVLYHPQFGWYWQEAELEESPTYWMPVPVPATMHPSRPRQPVATPALTFGLNCPTCHKTRIGGSGPGICECPKDTPAPPAKPRRMKANLGWQNGVHITEHDETPFCKHAPACEPVETAPPVELTLPLTWREGVPEFRAPGYVNAGNPCALCWHGFRHQGHEWTRTPWFRDKDGHDHPHYCWTNDDHSIERATIIVFARAK